MDAAATTKENADRAALLAGNNGTDKVEDPSGDHPLLRQDSLMEGVRRRLKSSTQAFLVPGVSGGDGSGNGETSSGQLVKHRLKPREACGREISISFRGLLLYGFTTVMVVTMAALLTTQIVISRDVSNSLIASCNEAADSFLNTTAELILDSLVFVAREKLLDASVDMKVYLMNQAQSQVGAMYNFIASSQLNRNINVNNNATSFNETEMFVSRQVQASYSNWIDEVAVGIISGNRFLDAALCHRPPINAESLIPLSAAGTCPFSVATTNGTDLVRCNQVFPAGQSIPVGCITYSNFSVAQQEPVRIQRSFATANPTNTTAMLMWSNPFVVQGLQFIFHGAIRDLVAVGLSYPVFTPTCQSYSCADAFIWAAVTARSLAIFCRNEVQTPNITDQFEIIQNDSVFFVVEGANSPLNGTLLGGAFGKVGTDIMVIPNVIQPATLSDVPSISLPSQYLLSQVGSFANQTLDDLFMHTFDPHTLKPCNESHTLSDVTNLGNCTLVAALSVSSPPTEPLFQTFQPARFVLVFSIPLRNLMNPLIQQYLAAQQKTNEQRMEQEQAISSLIGVGIGIAMASILAGIILAWIMAVRVTVPLGKLDKKMRNLMNFNFRVTEADYLSRVSDISRAERTLESLSDAIEVFSKFVPETVVRGIVQGRAESTQLHVEHRIVTVAFSDIKGFTSISEKLEISDLLFFLTRYLTVMTEVVERYEGTVTEILGDGLLVLWNAPDDCQSHAAKACAAAIAMQSAVRHVAREFHTILSMHGLENLSIRVGIHTGRVLAGNIGSETKLKYGCLGDTVNTASRLEGLCKLYEVGIICSKDTVNMLPTANQFQCRELDLVQVKGKDQALALYEVQALRQKVVIHPKNEGMNEPVPAAGGTGRAASKRLKLRSAASNLGDKARSALGLRPPSQPSRFSTASNSNGTRTSVQSFGPILESDFGDDQSVDKQLERARQYEEALHRFQHGDFHGASDILVTLASEDAAARLLLERTRAAQRVLEQGQLDITSWTGVNRLTEKF